MRALVTLIFFQMLPATLVVAGIRPLFAETHAGNVSAMHAFMSINMAAAVLSAPWIGRLADRTQNPGRLIAILAVIDALLLAMVAAPLPVAVVLILRFVEGAAHVGATTMLLHQASKRARASQEGRTMGLAGAAIVFAIAAGNGLGGATVMLAPQAPFLLAAVISLGVAVAALRIAPAPAASATLVAKPRLVDVLLPVTAAFVERFAIGCIIVSFALFAHTTHGLSDARIGWLYFALTFTFGLAVAPAGRLSDRLSRNLLLAAGALVYAIGLLALVLVPRPALVFAMITAGIGAAFMFSPALASTAGCTHERRGAAMAYFNAAGCLGMMLGPMVSGIVIALQREAGEAAYRGPIYLAAGATLIWLVAVLAPRAVFARVARPA